MKHRSLLVLLLLAAPAILVAQSLRGTITGRITDEQTGEGLPSVNVFLKGTYYGAATDIDGNYVIENVNPGEYTLEASIIGYTKMQFTGVKVSAGETQSLNIRLRETVLTIDQEIVVIGERPLLDIEQASSSRTIQTEDIQALPARNVQDVVSDQVGVLKTAEGIFIRGGRSYETEYYVDGVSAKDPLAGTGFGVDLGVSALQEVEITTGGIGAEFGATGGVISVTTREGGERYNTYLSYKRDNLGFNEDDPSNYNTDLYELNLSGPEPITEHFLPALGIDVPGSFAFFASITGYFSDEFTRAPAEQLNSSIFHGTRLAPRQDNRWGLLGKLSYKANPRQKFQFSYRRSVNINQNTRMLQLAGNNVVLKPGYQYDFALQPDNANTYTHDATLTSLKWTSTLSSKAFFELQVSRLFTRMRADANGRPFRPEFITSEQEPNSIITMPVSYWEFSDFDSVIFVLQGDPITAGLFNNGGIADLWHDHFAEEYTVKLDGTYHPSEKHKLRAGLETKFQEYQWIDIREPWVGAPIVPGDPPRSLGRTSDFWHVRPAEGALYVQDQITFNGLIAYLGLRFQYWIPGKLADDAVENPQSVIPERFRQGYRDDTFSLFGRRWKGRLLPRIRVSFPVSDNQMLYFNYGHLVDWPNAHQVYTGLDIARLDRSFLARVGNPTLDPESTVEYEIGLRNQFTADDVLTVSAFNKDKFDYVVRRYIPEIDRTSFVNEDYARILGIEVSYIKRIGRHFRGMFSGSYQVAKGKSNSAEDSFVRFTEEQTTKENFLAWDRPWFVRFTTNFIGTEDRALFAIAPLKNINIYVSATYQSGKRYTPLIFTGINQVTGRPSYREDFSEEFQRIGKDWFWMDLTIEKWFAIGTFDLSLSLEITNLFDKKNSTIINPLTGEAYELGDPTPFRDPLSPHPLDRGIPPFDPARFLEQRHILAGISVNF